MRPYSRNRVLDAIAQHKALENKTPETRLDPELTGELWREYYERHGRGWLTVVSGSMMPLIHVGDRILVTSIAPEDVRPGNLVAFRRDGNFVGHRVLEVVKDKEGPLFYEKGDAAAAVGTFREKDLVGRITVIRHGGSFLRLDTFTGDLTERIFAWWIRNVKPVISRLYQPSSRLLVYPGKALSLPLRAVNKLLIYACRFIWSFCGRSLKKAPSQA